MEILRRLGLTEAESKLYLALISTGPATIGHILKKTGFHKATAYQCLNRLLEKGLASSAKEGKKTYFKPADPKVLLEGLQENEAMLRESLPELEKRMKASERKQDVTVYQGVSGLRSALNSMLEELTPGGEYCDFGVSGLFRKVMLGYWGHLQREKKKRGVTSRCIFDERLRNDPQLHGGYVGKMRFHPSEYPSPTDTFIYNDKVMLVMWTANPPVAVVIKNEENAKGYKNQFELMWKSAMR